MSANAYRGEVSLPEAGEGAYLRLTLDGSAKLQGALGKEWLSAVYDGLGSSDIEIIKKCLEFMLYGADHKKASEWEIHQTDLQKRIGDAVSLYRTGRNLEEDEAWAEEQAIEKLRKQLKKAAALAEEFKDSPPAVAALLSRLGLTPLISQASSPTSSGD
jgi:hypothetical protein